MAYFFFVCATQLIYVSIAHHIIHFFLLCCDLTANIKPLEALNLGTSNPLAWTTLGTLI